MSAATSLYTAGQQLAATIGVSVGALALEIARTTSGHATPQTSDFSAAFVVVGLMSLARVAADIGGAQNGQPLGIRRHESIFDAIMDHFHKMP